MVQPYAADDGPPLLALAAATVTVAATAIRAVRWRDIHDGVLAGRTALWPRFALLGTVAGFALRQTLRPLAGWTVGVGAFYLLIGVLVVSATRFGTDNPRFAELAAAGFTGLGSVDLPSGLLENVLRNFRGRVRWYGVEGGRGERTTGRGTCRPMRGIAVVVGLASPRRRIHRRPCGVR
jgi:hypothetical protein